MAELKVEKSWVDGGQLFVKVACEDREKLTSGIREFVAQYIAKPENNLTAWMDSGSEKAECPQAYDPENPEMDPDEAGKAAAAKGRSVKWVYTQTVRLIKGI
jgi:hypothetical protein